MDMGSWCWNAFGSALPVAATCYFAGQNPGDPILGRDAPWVVARDGAQSHLGMADHAAMSPCGGFYQKAPVRRTNLFHVVKCSNVHKGTLARLWCRRHIRDGRMNIHLDDESIERIARRVLELQQILAPAPVLTMREAIDFVHVGSESAFDRWCRKFAPNARCGAGRYTRRALDRGRDVEARGFACRRPAQSD